MLTDTALSEAFMLDVNKNLFGKTFIQGVIKWETEFTWYNFQNVKVLENIYFNLPFSNLILTVESSVCRPDVNWHRDVISWAGVCLSVCSWLMGTGTRALFHRVHEQTPASSPSPFHTHNTYSQGGGLSNNITGPTSTWQELRERRLQLHRCSKTMVYSFIVRWVWMKVALYGGGFKVFEVLTFLIGRNSGERLRGV